jgi:toxin ParE1/3/4
MTKYRLTREAVSDLEKIWNYTYENYSIKQADKYYKLIISEIELISSKPFSGKSIDFIKEGYRVSQVRSHLIFYRINKDNIIEIVRILHQRMDVENRIK